ncbi:unnamed protein product [Staurois parvus]|uniref:Uncharacterized protein n=1 Tax=Staurois parvus TaxID=386267 RepID=A0ABN9AVZ5_9NEOB|nr:unnamed protein product [Staurois parvus]
MIPYCPGPHELSVCPCTVLMALGKKGLTCGAIKGLTVCCFTVCCVCASL